MDRPALGDVEDLATLANLDETILLEEIKERYRQDKIYTYVGDILIAVNPFKDIGIYGKEYSAKYHNGKRSALPPHIFAVADAAYQALQGNSGRPAGNQCVLISGESGAGKTESTKLIIKQIVDLCQGNTQLEQQILQVNPLLEAFGNAQTNLNDNSSRFGKYIQLRFKSGHLVGAKISEYLLEKSRVVRQNAGEKNFHIFYYLFASKINSKLGLGDPSDNRYLTHRGQQIKSNYGSLFSQYEELVNAMDLVGFTDQEQDDMFTVIASVLQLGNITFSSNESDDTLSVADSQRFIQSAANLLGIDASEIAACLTCMVTVTKGDHVKRNYNLDQAEDARDAMAKAIYGRLFGWIVYKINCVLDNEGQEQNFVFSEIGILDIFGFEDFEKSGGMNSFEQACINLANEQLQFFFNQHIFHMEQEEYKREGIDWNEIKFVDNKPLLDMFLAKPIGVLSLLDEESLFPQATDLSYVNKLNKELRVNENFTKSQQTNQALFTINHYAGKVTYTVDKWLEKNRDTLPPGIIELLQTSNNVLVKTIFRGQITRTGSLTLAKKGLSGIKSKKKGLTVQKDQTPMSTSQDAATRKLTVGAQFKNSLNKLMERMTSSTPIFVRCLKPNHLKKPGDLDRKYVLAQLLYTGMLETVEIRRKGFAVRPTFANFVDKYKILVDLKMSGTSNNCITILKSANLHGWCLGKTKIFLKYSHIEQLTELLNNMSRSAVQIQRVARGFFGRKEFKKRKECARQETELLETMLQQAMKFSIESAEKLNVLNGHGPSKQNDIIPVSPGQSSLDSTSNIITANAKVDDGTGPNSSLTGDLLTLEQDGSERATTKEAAVNWFKETQTYNVKVPNQERFAEWFHGIISRREAERLLKYRFVGCFLIRVSESRFGYTLSFKAETRCRHYMIDQLKNGKFIIIGEPKVHRSLHDLIDYHKKVKISNWDNLLTVPCGQDQGECDYYDLVRDAYSVPNNLDVKVNTNKSGESILQQSAKKLSPSSSTFTQQRAASPLEANASKRPLPKLPEEAYLKIVNGKDDNKNKPLK